MKQRTKKRTLFFLILIHSFCYARADPPKIIFDTDFGGDADDLGALVMLHNLMDRGECELLGIGIWNFEKYSAPAVDAINRYYGHSNIPMGTRQEDIKYEEWQYNKTIVDAIGSEINHTDLPDTTTFYRKLLSEQKDDSITFITVGPLLNIQRLLDSPPDTISNLSGEDLVGKKVKEFVIMGGHFPSGKEEWNFFGRMPGVTQSVLSRIDSPTTFLGYELGFPVKTGKNLNAIDPKHPLYVAFLHFSEHAFWMTDSFKGDISDNASFDQTAILYAVRGGVGTYWDRVSGGYVEVESNGDNRWIAGRPGNQSYLKLTAPPSDVAQLIESIMMDTF